MKNGLKTAILMASMAGLLMFLGSFFGRGGMTFAFIISMVMIGASYFFSDKLAIKAARAVEVQPGQIPEYEKIVNELSSLAEMPAPKIYVSPEPQPNAFATGRGPKHAAVCVTQGLLQTLEWDEIRGVLAHELAHIKNRDILTGSVAAMIASTISFAANMALFSSRRDRDVNPLLVLVLSLLAPIAASIIQMAISRSREFEADRSAARLIKDGEPLARALEKLNISAHQIKSSVPPAQASAYIANPLSNRSAGFSSWFSTHPRMEERVSRLRSGEWAN